MSDSNPNSSDNKQPRDTVYWAQQTSVFTKTAPGSPGFQVWGGMARAFRGLGWVLPCLLTTLFIDHTLNP